VKEFSFQINDAQLFKEAEANFREKTRSTMSSQLNEMFSEPRAYRSQFSSKYASMIFWVFSSRSLLAMRS
jgi:hypothetical protein